MFVNLKYLNEELKISIFANTFCSIPFEERKFHLGFSMTLAGLVIVLSFPLVSQMIGRKDKATNEKLKTEYNALNSKIHQLNEELAVLRLRDDSIYSGVFGVKPIAKSLLVGGTGGSDKLEHLRGYGSNSDLMLTSGKQLLQLEAKIKIHQSRFKKIENLSRTRLGKLAAIPAVQPIHNHNLIRIIDFSRKVFALSVIRKFLILKKYSHE